eukprot:1935196-Pyramimonas_sp.AAC.1
MPLVRQKVGTHTPPDPPDRASHHEQTQPSSTYSGAAQQHPWSRPRDGAAAPPAYTDRETT